MLRKLYESEPVMIIVAIGWLYVVMMIAAVSDTLLTGVLRLLFLGVLPVGLLLWIKLKSWSAHGYIRTPLSWWPTTRWSLATSD